MTNIVLDAISRLTGNDFLSRCIKLCEFEDFSELINIDDRTLDKMEIFLQKKCSRMSFNERRIFMGDNFAENPDLFKFSPGNRQKILNVMENLSKIFTNSNLQFSLFNLKEICKRYEINDRSALTTIPRNALKMVLSNENIPTELANNSQMKSFAITDEPIITNITQSRVIQNPSESYPNIFQRMDLLRKGEIKVNESVEDKNMKAKEKSISYEKNLENSITNKENKEQTEKSLKVKRVMKRKADDDDPDYEEPANKKLREYRKHNRKSKFLKRVKLSKDSTKSDSTDSDNSIPLRSRSQRLIDKSKMSLETQKIEEPVQRVKRKYTKHVKEVPILETTPANIVKSHLPNELTTEKLNQQIIIENKVMENLSTSRVFTVSNTSTGIASTKSNHLDATQSITDDDLQNLNVKSLNFKTNVENILKLSTSNNKTSYLKILPNPNQNFGVKLIGSLNKNENLSQINPAQNVTKQSTVLIQPKIINSNQLKVNIVSSSDTNKFLKPNQSIKPLNVNISTVSLPSKDQLNQSVGLQPIKPKLKLSDVPFQCFEVNTIKKAPIKSRHISALTKIGNIPKISINSSVQQKNTNIDSKSKMQSSIINANQVKVIQIPKTSPVVNQIIEPSKENFTDQINPIKSTSSSNFRFEPVKLLDKSILSAKTPIINSGGLQVTPEQMNNFEEVMDNENSLNFSVKLDCTSTPKFFTNRFVNGTKHKKSISELGETIENKSQSENNKSVDIPKQYLY